MRLEESSRRWSQSRGLLKTSRVCEQDMNRVIPVHGLMAVVFHDLVHVLVSFCRGLSILPNDATATGDLPSAAPLNKSSF
jgi:hypothetical protein